MNPNQQKTIKRIVDNRGFWMVVSLIVAVILWLYVNSTEGVEVEKVLSGVKIEFVGADALRESSGLIVTEKDRDSVNLTIKGTRRVIGNLSSANVSAEVDLSRVTTDGRYSYAYNITYPSGVNSDDITLVRSSADVINFYVDRLTRKTIPVEGAFTGNTAEGYLAEDNLVFDPVMVTISGPKTAVSLADHAYVAINRTDVDKTLSYSTTYLLKDADGVTVDDSRIILETDTVNVTLNVLATKTVPLDVTIVNGAGATREDNTSITIEPDSIVLSGDAAAIDSTSKINLGTIDLSSFASEYTATYTIVPPNDTENITGVNEANVTVKIVGLSNKGFNILHDNISCINVPEGYDAEIITQTLPVTIRATDEVLREIQVNNLRAVADLSGINDTTASGVITPAVKIHIDGFPEAGYIGEYRIYVTLKESEE